MEKENEWKSSEYGVRVEKVSSHFSNKETSKGRDLGQE